MFEKYHPATIQRRPPTDHKKPGDIYPKKNNDVYCAEMKVKAYNGILCGNAANRKPHGGKTQRGKQTKNQPPVWSLRGVSQVREYTTVRRWQ